ncbi:hypothetical protein FPV67DRAFT_82271 [Lyophyllum atratum]|nr:hypothetical protein FPV67DRAFT_82271 [Lyophyllum atratum]
MTSRVQKGGPIFRPVVKSRARPDVRQPSATTDTSNGTQYSTPPSFHPTSMPPPTTTMPSDMNLIQNIVPDPSSPNVLPLNLIAPPEPPRRTPSLDTSGPTLVMSNSNRSGPSSPTLTSRPTLAPVILRPAPPSILPSYPTAPSVEPSIQNSSSTVVLSQLTSAPSHILHHSGAENVPTSALNAGVIIKPQRTTTGNKPVAVASDSNEGLDGGPEAEAMKRTKRSKSTRAGSTSRKPPPKTKKVASTSNVEGSNDETPEPAEGKRKRRASSSTPRPRRSRGPSLAPYDPDADPGEEIDPTVVTMASLCSDTGQGRVSRKAAEILSNHAAWKSQNREKRARMKALMELKKYGREEEAEALEEGAAPSEKTPGEAVDAGPSNTLATNPAIADDTGSGFDYTQDLATSRFNVQVRIGPNGETIIDEDSLVVDRTEAEDTTNYTHVVESDHTKFVNSGSYGKRYRGSRWSAEETELFYDALAQYGENYELIAYVLPGRDRKSCKNKFKAEDKKNPARINHCLNNNIPVDMVTLSRMTGKDFSGPVPEIRVPTPQPIVDSVEAINEQEIATADHVRKKKPKKSSPDDGVLVVGDADSFVPFPDSP